MRWLQKKIPKQPHLLCDRQVSSQTRSPTSSRNQRLGELAERGRLENIRGQMNVAALWAWPFVQGMAWWNMVAACQDAKDNASNTINCVWGIITSAITLAATEIQTAIWFKTITNAYILGVTIHRRSERHRSSVPSRCAGRVGSHHWPQRELPWSMGSCPVRLELL